MLAVHSAVSILGHENNSISAKAAQWCNWDIISGCDSPNQACEAAKYAFVNTFNVQWNYLEENPLFLNKTKILT